MYVRLFEGEIINKTIESERFGVDERSIQCDIDDIGAFLDERATSGSGDEIEIVYDRKGKGFKMIGAERLMKLEMKFFSKNTKAVLDRLPTVRILEQTDDYAMIEAEVYGEGIIRMHKLSGNQKFLQFNA